MRTQLARWGAVLVIVAAGATPARLMADLAPAFGARPVRSDTLQPGRAVRRDLGGGEEHSYEIWLSQGTVASITAEQRGTDLRLRLHSPDGTLVAERDNMDALEAGFERLSFAARVTGLHRLTVASLRRAGSRGAYVLTLSEPSIATTMLNRLVTADSALAAATKTRGHERRDSLLATVPRATAAVAAARAAGSEALEAEALTLLGDTWVELQQADSGRAALGAALALFEQQRDWRGQARIHHKLSVAAFTSNDAVSATRHLEAGLQLARRDGLSLNESNIEAELGYVLTLRGQLDSARIALEHSLHLATSVSDGGQQVNALTNLTRVFQRTGEYERQLQTLAELARVARATNDTLSEAIAENNQGLVFGDIGRDREAVAHYERALQLLERLDEPRGRARIHANISVILGKTMPDSALARFRIAVSLQDSIGDVNGKVTALANMAQIYLDRKREPRLAAVHLDSAFRLVNRDADPRTASIIIGTLAKAVDRLGLTDSSERLLRTSLVLSGRARDIRTQAITYQVLAAHWERRGALDSSRVLLERGIRLWEAIWRSAQASGVQSSLFAQFANDYAFYTDVLLRQSAIYPDSHFVDRAFEMAERARARSLHESLRDIRLRSASAPDSVTRAAELGLRAAIDRAAAAYSGSPSRETERVVDSLLAVFDARQSAARARNRPMERSSAPATLSADQIRTRLLDAESVLLEYELGDSRSHLWVLRRDTLASYLLPGRDSLARLAERLFVALSARAVRRPGERAQQWTARVASADIEVGRVSRTLSDVLLAPAASLLSGRTLIIVPHGALYFVPFGVLPAPSTSEPLIVRHAITYLPSSSTAALLRLPRHGATARDELVVVADPVLSTDDARVTLAGTRAPSTPPSLSRGMSEGALAQSLRAARGPDNTQLERLPHAREEAEAIARLVGRSRTRRLFDFSARLDQVVDTPLATARVVHFASHALYNNDKPELSGIVLSQVDSTGQPIDGYMRLHHIYEMEWKSDLIVLSACETALGQRLDGEGMISLARGFLQAGASRVVGSLWKTDDRATASLMTAFYRAMYQQGQSPAEALRRAQIAMSRSPRYSHPYYWSAFALTGDWQ